MSKLQSIIFAALCGCFLLTGAVTDAKAERRIAMVVGNANYKNPSLVLSNPKNDAEDVASALRSLGFEVIQAVDTNKRDLDLSMAKFARLATDSDAVLFYYAGHALQYQGRNYLMPTDAEVEDEVSLRYQMMPIDDVRAALDRASGVKVMILDACRNNPVVESLRRKIGGESRALGGGVRGLARIDKTQGTVIAYSTAADEVAADGQGRNSPFTSALLSRLKEPGLEIEQLFRRVASDVNSATGGRQRPETYVSLLSDFYLNQTDRVAFDAIKDSANPAGLRDFIARFPTSSYASDARYRIQRIELEAQEQQLQKARQQEATRLLAQQSNADQEAAARKADEERAKLAEAERLLQQQRTKLARVETPDAAVQDLPSGTPAPRPEPPVKIAAVERQDPVSQSSAAQSPRIVAEPTAQPLTSSSSKSCDQDGAKLARLRGGGSLEDVVRFEAELSCDRLRPQVARLRESLAPAETSIRPVPADTGRKSVAADNDGSSSPDRKRITEAKREIPEFGSSSTTNASDQAPNQQVASLPDTPEPGPAKPSGAELTKYVKAELSRVGCFSGTVDGEWNSASRRSLESFNKRAGTKLDVKVASLDALDVIKGKTARVCPMVCEHGFKTDGERCSRIVCAEGSVLNDDNECEKRRARTPVATRDREESPARARPKAEASPARPQASGQIVCDTTGCHPVARGCHLEFRTTIQGGPREGGGGNVQICN
jgi:uncharacterized caspase-like protein